jgi:FlaA1/EpsC-like NDP-sugar epimerase
MGGAARRKQIMTPVAIMGAGEAGSLIVRELLRNPQLGLRVVAFFDDDPSKWRMRLHNIPVVGNRYAIPEAAVRYRFRQVIIAMPTAPGREIRDIVGICERAGVTTKIMPGMYELLGGKVQVTQLRNVEIEDLLRREPIRTDIEAVRELIRGKRVMVTGGGGSIGSELARQIWRFGPAQLILLGHGENSIFEIYHELQERRLANPGPTGGVADEKPILTPVIADIRFADQMQLIFQRYRPEIVFHAAAHKHVPLMELNPTEAVTNNILGTWYLLQAALASGVNHFVMISTDKAVNPTSIMGASKRVAELLVQEAAQRSGKPYVAVRFGNVLGSRGSVVHTFKRQIAAGGPVTVTHPEMRRYFMTIPEAVQLVLQASVLGKGGEVFVLDMGEPIRIVDLARDLIELSGLEVGRDIEIVFTGPRPGEKLFEELFVDGENYTRTRHEKIYVATHPDGMLPFDLDDGVMALAVAARRHDREAIIRLLQNLVPEYRPPDVLMAARSDDGTVAVESKRLETGRSPVPGWVGDGYIGFS